MATMTWTQLASFPKYSNSASVRGSMCGIIGNTIYQAGGYDETSYWNGMYWYDTVGNTWTNKSGDTTNGHSMLNSNGFASSFGGSDGYFYVFGGHYQFNQKYWPATNTWTTISGPSNTEGAGWCYPKDGSKMYMVGGSATGTTRRFDVASQTFTDLAAYPNPGQRIITAIDGNFIYATGNQTFNASSANAYKYDIAANIWTQIATAPQAIASGAGYAGGGKFYVISGENSAGTMVTTQMVYDTGSNSWIQEESGLTSTQARFDAGVTVAPNGKVYLMGGYRAGIDTDTTFVASYPVNTAPATPGHQNIASLGSTTNQYPKFFFSVSDPDSGNTITNVQVQASSSSTFATTLWDAQYANDSGYGVSTPSAFTGLPTASNAASTVALKPATGAFSAFTAGTWYIRVRTKDNSGTWSAWSATQQFTVAAVPWNDTPNGYGMKAQWMNDLATVINNARQFRGLSTFSFTDGTISAQNTSGNGTDIKATHITERRTKLTDVLTVAGVTPTWTNATINNTKDRSSQDIIDLRTYCSQT